MDKLFGKKKTVEQQMRFVRSRLIFGVELEQKRKRASNASSNSGHGT